MHILKRDIHMKIIRVLTAGALALCMGSAQAALFDRGGGLLYDDVLNVTWLQDANYAETSGYCSVSGNCAYSWGVMTAAQANTWASNLVYHDSANGQDYVGWQLASNSPVKGSTWNINYSADGSTDDGYNITSPNSMLSYMYYVNLGLKGAVAPNGWSQFNYGVLGTGGIGGEHNIGLVKNLYSYDYWSGSVYAEENPWYFSTRYGFQSYDASGNLKFAWAVQMGDIAAVPEPETYAVLLAGLGLIGVSARRNKRS